MKLWLLPVFSGLLLALAYPPYDLEFLVWFGFLPLFYFLKQNRGDRKSFLAGLSAGTIYFLIVLKWFWSVYPLDWLGIENPLASAFLILLIWSLIALGMGLWWGVSSIFAAQNILLFPFIFAVSEYIRSWFFGFISAGPGTLWGPHWTMGNLAYSLHESSLFLWLSSFVGIYGITLFIVLANVLILKGLKDLRAKSVLIAGSAIVVLVLASTIGLKEGTESNKKISIAVIQSRIPTGAVYPAEKRLEDFKRQLSLVKEAAGMEKQPQAVIFPEGADFFKNLSLFLDAGETKDFFERTFAKTVLIVDNSKIDEGDGFKSRVIYLDSKTGALGHYDKKMLTPVGEFVPFYLKPFINAPLRNYSKGTADSKVTKTEKIETGALVCSAIYSQGLFNRLAKQNHGFLIIMASTAVFDGAEDLLKQNLAAVKFRAAETGRYAVLAANFGYSYIVSDKGLVEKISPDKDWRLFTAEVVPRTERTWYNKLRDFPVLILALSTIFALIVKRRTF